jgi:hypothetical protein
VRHLFLTEPVIERLGRGVDAGLSIAQRSSMWLAPRSSMGFAMHLSKPPPSFVAKFV